MSHHAPFVIALHGEPGSGKDTVGDILVREHGFARIAFADKLRDMSLALDPLIALNGYAIRQVRLSELVTSQGWDRAKRQHPEIRRTLQRMGTEVIRQHVSENFWAEHVRDQILGSGRNHVITDMRFASEADTLRGHLSEIWWLHRPDNPHALPDSSHASEQWHPVLDDPQLPVCSITNDGTIEELSHVVRAALSSVNLIASRGV